MLTLAVDAIGNAISVTSDSTEPSWSEECVNPKGACSIQVKSHLVQISLRDRLQPKGPMPSMKGRPHMV